VTRTVLQNIAVLSAGQTIQTDGKSQSMIVPVVTLLVDPQEAEALTLANNEGHIQLVLRNSTDDKRAATSGRQLHDLYGVAPTYEASPPAGRAPARRVPPKAATPPVPSPTVPHPVPQVDQVIVMHGATRKVEVFAK
jgi:pilus assembly protein CpaB